MAEKTIGILGGMGPEATWDFFGRIIKRTPARQDAEHIRVVMESNPKIPDRTKAILGRGPSPADAMIAAGENLERAGADFIAIPCMTAHYFIESVQDALRIPIINAFVLLRNHLEELAQVRKAVVIATTGSLRSGIYQRYLPEERLLFPDEHLQASEVMDIIYGPRGIKAGYSSGEPLDRLRDLAARFQEQGADALIAGCTEISLVLRNQKMPIAVIDPLDLLAAEAVRLVKGV